MHFMEKCNLSVYHYSRVTASERTVCTMTDVVQVYDYRFPNTDWPIMRFRVRISEIARSRGFEIESWEEDGLGQAHGMLLRLPSGRVILVRELQHGIDHFREMGPYVHIDAAVVAEFGVEPLMSEVLTSLGLSPQIVDWQASGEAQQSAIDFVKWAAAYRKQKE